MNWSNHHGNACCCFLIPVPRDGHATQTQVRHLQGDSEPGAPWWPGAVSGRDGGVECVRGQPLRGGARQIRQRLQRHPAGLRKATNKSTSVSVLNDELHVTSGPAYFRLSQTCAKNCSW